MFASVLNRYYRVRGGFSKKKNKNTYFFKRSVISVYNGNKKIYSLSELYLRHFLSLQVILRIKLTIRTDLNSFNHALDSLERFQIVKIGLFHLKLF